jgi:hypothetical protein
MNCRQRATSRLPHTLETTYYGRTRAVTLHSCLFRLAHVVKPITQVLCAVLSPYHPFSLPISLLSGLSHV